MKNPRIVFSWMQSRSEASKKGWQTRWERGEAVGPKGRDYLVGRGPGSRGAGPTKGGGPGRGGRRDDVFEDYEDFEDYDDVWDFEDDY